MKLAIIGSRGITNMDIAPYIPKDVTEIISGGATGIDTLAEEYADKKKLSKHIIRPQYNLFPSKVAPLKRNETIIELCDILIAFWDGKSKGTLSTINKANKLAKQVIVYEVIDENITQTKTTLSSQ